jgi:hypothetical protein
MTRLDEGAQKVMIRGEDPDLPSMSSVRKARASLPPPCIETVPKTHCKEEKVILKSGPRISHCKTGEPILDGAISSRHLSLSLGITRIIQTAGGMFFQLLNMVRSK